MEGQRMARIYHPVGPSDNKAISPAEEAKKPPEKPKKTEGDGK